MRIILKEDVKDLGRAGDVVTVAEGYGRNYLLPRKLAVLATPGNMKDLEKRIQAAKERQAKERQEAMALVDRLRQLKVTVTHRAAEGTTRLHGSVTAAEIAERLNALLSPARPIDRREIEIRDQIRSLGEHPVNVRLGRGVTATITVEVLDESAAREAARERPAPPEAAAEPEATAPPAEAAGDATEPQE